MSMASIIDQYEEFERQNARDTWEYNLVLEQEKLLGYLTRRMGKHLWFITVTLSPKLYKYQSLTQFELTYMEFKDIICKYTHVAAISTELTKEGNIHYHAILYFENDFNRFSVINTLKGKRKYFGFIKLTSDPIDNKESLDRATNYLIKDLNTTLKVLGNKRRGFKPLIFYIL